MVLTKIRDLNLLDTGVHNRSIKASVTIKSIEHDNENKIYFYMDLQDETGAISAVTYNAACAKFYDEINEYNTYIFTNFKLAFAKKEYTSVKHNKELILEVYSDIERVNAPLVMPEYNFVPLGHIEKTNKYFVDVIARFDPWECEGEQNVMCQNGNIKSLLRVPLQDKTCFGMNLTVWNNEIDLFWEHAPPSPVVLLKDARVNDFNGALSLTTTRYVDVLDMSDPRVAILIAKSNCEL